MTQAPVSVFPGALARCADAQETPPPRAAGRRRLRALRRLTARAPHAHPRRPFAAVSTAVIDHRRPLREARAAARSGDRLSRATPAAPTLSRRRGRAGAR